MPLVSNRNFYRTSLLCFLLLISDRALSLPVMGVIYGSTTFLAPLLFLLITSATFRNTALVIVLFCAAPLLMKPNIELVFDSVAPINKHTPLLSRSISPIPYTTTSIREVLQSIGQGNSELLTIHSNKDIWKPRNTNTIWLGHLGQIQPKPRMKTTYISSDSLNPIAHKFAAGKLSEHQTTSIYRPLSAPLLSLIPKAFDHITSDDILNKVDFSGLMNTEYEEIVAGEKMIYIHPTGHSLYEKGFATKAIANLFFSYTISNFSDFESLIFNETRNGEKVYLNLLLYSKQIAKYAYAIQLMLQSSPNWADIKDKVIFVMGSGSNREALFQVGHYQNSTKIVNSFEWLGIKRARPDTTLINPLYKSNYQYNSLKRETIFEQLRIPYDRLINLPSEQRERLFTEVSPGEHYICYANDWATLYACYLIGKGVSHKGGHWLGIANLPNHNLLFKASLISDNATSWQPVAYSLIHLLGDSLNIQYHLSPVLKAIMFSVVIFALFIPLMFWQFLNKPTFTSFVILQTALNFLTSSYLIHFSNTLPPLLIEPNYLFGFISIVICSFNIYKRQWLLLLCTTVSGYFLFDSLNTLDGLLLVTPLLLSAMSYTLVRKLSFNQTPLKAKYLKLCKKKGINIPEFDYIPGDQFQAITSGEYTFPVMARSASFIEDGQKSCFGLLESYMCGTKRDLELAIGNIKTQLEKYGDKGGMIIQPFVLAESYCVCTLEKSSHYATISRSPYHDGATSGLYNTDVQIDSINLDERTNESTFIKSIQKVFKSHKTIILEYAITNETITLLQVKLPDSPKNSKHRAVRISEVIYSDTPNRITSSFLSKAHPNFFTKGSCLYEVKNNNFKNSILNTIKRNLTTLSSYVKLIDQYKSDIHRLGLFIPYQIVNNGDNRADLVRLLEHSIAVQAELLILSASINTSLSLYMSHDQKRNKQIFIHPVNRCLVDLNDPVAKTWRPTGNLLFGNQPLKDCIELPKGIRNSYYTPLFLLKEELHLLNVAHIHYCEQLISRIHACNISTKDCNCEDLSIEELIDDSVSTFSQPSGTYTHCTSNRDIPESIFSSAINWRSCIDEWAYIPNKDIPYFDNSNLQNYKGIIIETNNPQCHIVLQAKYSGIEYYLHTT